MIKIEKEVVYRPVYIEPNNKTCHSIIKIYSVLESTNCAHNTKSNTSILILSVEICMTAKPNQTDIYKNETTISYLMSKNC